MKPSKTWLQTFPSGSAAELIAFDESIVHPEDIAQHLGHLCRFSGGTRKFYSVAEHCVRVSKAIEESMNLAGSFSRAEVVEASMCGLMHDASEAYTGDVTQPLKMAMRQVMGWFVGKGTREQVMSPFDVLEKQVQQVIANRFGLPFPWPAVVSHFDLVLLVTEKRDLLAEQPQPWAIPPDLKPLEERIEPYSVNEAGERWLLRFLRLGGVL